jgi:hypothetical protein
MSKYGNTKCSVGSETYRSKREMRRHQSLLLLQREGTIRNLRREVVYVLADAVTIQGRRRPSLRYVADFVYEHGQVDWATVVEDAKGVRTEGYRIKRHLMKSVHNIDILET